MNDIIFDSLPNMDVLSNYNIENNSNSIEIYKEKEKIQCFYICRERKALLVEICDRTGITNIFPTNTIEGSLYFLESKYDGISFSFEGYNVEIDKIDLVDDDEIGRAHV